MSIQIIDNFKLGTNTPIDNRFVVGTGYYYVNKEDIEHKYEGLRIWDVSTFLGYIWTEGAWVAEFTDNGTVGPGTVGNIPMFTDTDEIGDSVILQNTSNNIGIGMTPLYKLDVNGDVRGNSFIGNINASSLSIGQVPLARLSGATSQVLVGNGTTVASSWQDLDALEVRTSTYVNITTLNSSSPGLMVPVISLGSIPYESRLSTSNIFYKTGNVYIGSTTSTSSFSDGKLNVDGNVRINGSVKLEDGSYSVPTYTFNSSLSTGLYKVSGTTPPYTYDGVGITIGGQKCFTFQDGGGSFPNQYSTTLSFHNTVGASDSIYYGSYFHLTNNLEVQGDLDVTGYAGVLGNLDVGGDTEILGDLDVAGVVDFDGNLRVSGITQLLTTSMAHADVNGNLDVTGSSRANEFKVNGLNTAPSSSSDTGITGDIRYTDGFIYFCIATDTWQRALLANY